MTVKVKFGPGKPELAGDCLIVHTTARRENNMANADVMKQVSDFYGKETADIRLLRGRTSRTKILEIRD